MNDIGPFGRTAQRLGQSPLGIVALFIVLVYGVAGYVATSSQLASSERALLVYFLITFPVIVLLSFLYLVICHSGKLYRPGDFSDEGNYLRALGIAPVSPKERVEQSARSVESTRDSWEPVLKTGASNAQLLALQYITRWNSPEMAEIRNHGSSSLLWNFFEELGLAVSQSLIDEDMVRQFFSGIVAREWQRAEPVVRDARERGGGSALYENFQKLAKRWSTA